MDCNCAGVVTGEDNVPICLWSHINIVTAGRLAHERSQRRADPRQRSRPFSSFLADDRSELLAHPSLGEIAEGSSSERRPL